MAGKSLICDVVVNILYGQDPAVGFCFLSLANLNEIYSCQYHTVLENASTKSEFQQDLRQKLGLSWYNWRGWIQSRDPSGKIPGRISSHYKYLFHLFCIVFYLK